MKTPRLGLLVFLGVPTVMAYAAASKKPSAPEEAPAVNAPAAPKSPNAVEREYLVAFENADVALKRPELFSKYALRELEHVGSSPLYLVEISPGADAAKMRRELPKEPGVRYVEPNYKVHIMPLKEKKLTE